MSRSFSKKITHTLTYSRKPDDLNGHKVSDSASGITQLVSEINLQFQVSELHAKFSTDFLGV